MAKNEESRTLSVDSDASKKTGGLLFQFRYVIIISVLFTGLSIYYALTYFPELSTLRAVGAGLGSAYSAPCVQRLIVNSSNPNYECSGSFLRREFDETRNPRYNFSVFIQSFVMPDAYR